MENGPASDPPPTRLVLDVLRAAVFTMENGPASDPPCDPLQFLQPKTDPPRTGLDLLRATIFTTSGTHTDTHRHTHTHTLSDEIALTRGPPYGCGVASEMRALRLDITLCWQG